MVVNMTDRIMTTAEVAERLCVSPHRLRHWLKKGWGPTYFRKPSGQMIFKESDIVPWLESMRVPPADSGRAENAE